LGVVFLAEDSSPWDSEIPYVDFLAGTCQRFSVLVNRDTQVIGATSYRKTAETCSDNIKNQDEQSVDCGGKNCAACEMCVLATSSCVGCLESVAKSGNPSSYPDDLQPVACGYDITSSVESMNKWKCTESLSPPEADTYGNSWTSAAYDRSTWTSPTIPAKNEKMTMGSNIASVHDDAKIGWLGYADGSGSIAQGDKVTCEYTVDNDVKLVRYNGKSNGLSLSMTANAAISGFNNEQMAGTVDECKTACRSRFWCKSFDYYKNAAKCDLSSASASDVGGLKLDYHGHPYNHYGDDTATWSHWPTVKSISFTDEGPSAFLEIIGYNREANGCTTGGFALRCSSENPESLWNGFTTDLENWKASGTDSELEFNTVEAAWGVCESSTNVGLRLSTPTTGIWASNGLKYARFKGNPYGGRGTVYCAYARE